MNHSVVKGLTEGKNYPNRDEMHINSLSRVVLVDLNYFVEHFDEIKEAALKALGDAIEEGIDTDAVAAVNP